MAQAQLSDGPRITGQWKSVSASQLVMVVDNQDRVFDVQSVQELKFSDPSNDPVAGPRVTLTDGTVYRAVKLRVSKEGKAEIGTMSGEAARCDAKSVASVRYFSDGDEALAKQWSEIVDSRGREDFLVVNKSGNLDYLAGVVGQIGAESLEFVYGGNELDIPMSRVAGLVFAKRPPRDDRPRAVVTTVHGSVWQTRDLSSTGDTIRLTSVAGATQSLPIAAIGAIEFIRAGVVYVTDLSPESQNYRPYFPSNLAGKRLQALGAPRHDVSFAGTSLKIVDQDGSIRSFEKGLAVQSRTELSYRLAKEYQRFQATVGFDPEATSHGDVELLLVADDQQIFNQAISRDDKAFELDVSVSNVNRLKVIVDFGKNMDIGDRLHLGGAKLIK